MKLIRPFIASSLILTMFFIATFVSPNITKASKLIQEKEEKKEKKKTDQEKKVEKLTAEELAEVVIFSYGGRPELELVRTSGVEEGTIKLLGDDKEIEGRITKKFSRKNPKGLDLTRIDVKLPNQEITFGFNGFTVWAARDGVGFSPEAGAEKSFSASLVHNYEALLRYKEQESTLERAGKETVVGIDTLLLDLTHRDGSKTRYYISAKSYRILHLEYEITLADDKPTKFRESFYDFRPIQNTLVPAKSILFENGKQIQEILYTQIRYKLPFPEETFLKY